jgi:hypothetical protein
LRGGGQNIQAALNYLKILFEEMSAVLNGTRLSTFCRCEEPVSQSRRRGNLSFKFKFSQSKIASPQKAGLAMTQLLNLVPLSAVLVSSRFKYQENEYDGGPTAGWRGFVDAKIF